jgi:hypothetical protein
LGFEALRESVYMSANPVSKPMSLEEARQVPMMFERYQGRTIGSLLDSGELQHKDLVYAANKAFSERLRVAAQVIVSHLQNELTTTDVRPPLNVISAERRSYAERKQLEVMLYQGIIVGILIGIAVALLAYGFLNRSPAQSERSWETLATPVGIIVVLILILVWAVGVFVVSRVMDWITEPLIRQMKLHRKGQLGEERVLHGMYYALDGDWWLFRNLELPKKGDMDFVLVGQSGIWVFEVKAYNGDFRNWGENWEAHIGSRWIAAFKNPTKQAKGNATALNQFLASKNLGHWVNPVVVWSNPESTVNIETPAIPVLTLDNLTTELRKLDSKNRLSAEKLGQVVEILSRQYPKNGDEVEM